MFKICGCKVTVILPIWGSCLKSAVTLEDVTQSESILTPSSMCLRSCDPSATQPHATKKPPPTSGFQFPVSSGHPAWHGEEHLKKMPNNKHADPRGAEWHIFHRLWRAAVLRILPCIWNSLCTACRKNSNWRAQRPLVDAEIRPTASKDERGMLTKCVLRKCDFLTGGDHHTLAR